jgi:hypothetical protein
MINIFVFEVGKKFSDFCEIAYNKTDDYCLIHMDNFIWYIGTCLNDPYQAQHLLAKYIGISPLNQNSIVQINKL